MKVYLGSSIWRDINARTSECLSGLYLAMERRGVAWEVGTIVGDALVSRSRSIAASNFLRSDCDVLLTIDSDIVFNPADTISLCEKCLSGYDIIGALYMKRVHDSQPAIPLPAELIMQDNQEPVSIRWASSGFTATSRRVFEALAPLLPLCAQADPEPFWPFYQPMVVEDPHEGYIYLSEDWSLSQRAIDLGYFSYVDPTIRVGHYGSVEVRVEDFARPPRPQEQAVRWRNDGKSIFMDMEG